TAFSCGSLELMVTVLVRTPEPLPVSTCNLILPDLPAAMVFGKSTVVHPQLGATDSILSTDLPTFLTTKSRTIFLSGLTVPKSIFLETNSIFGAVARSTGGVETGCAVGDAIAPT